MDMNNMTAISINASILSHSWCEKVQLGRSAHTITFSSCCHRVSIWNRYRRGIHLHKFFKLPVFPISSTIYKLACKYMRVLTICTSIVCLLLCLLFFIVICVHYCIDVVPVVVDMNSIQFNSKYYKLLKPTSLGWMHRQCTPRKYYLRYVAWSKRRSSSDAAYMDIECTCLKFNPTDYYDLVSRFDTSTDRK